MQHAVACASCTGALTAKQATWLLQALVLTAPFCLCRWWRMRCSSGRRAASTPPRKRVRGEAWFERIFASVERQCSLSLSCNTFNIFLSANSESLHAEALSQVLSGIMASAHLTRGLT